MENAFTTGTVFMNAASQSYEIGIAFFPLITAIRKSMYMVCILSFNDGKFRRNRIVSPWICR